MPMGSLWSLDQKAGDQWLTMSVCTSRSPELVSAIFLVHWSLGWCSPGQHLTTPDDRVLSPSLLSFSVPLSFQIQVQ